MAKEQIDQQQYISVADLAKKLGISRVAVFKRIKSGSIKAVKIGRSYAIPKSYLSEDLSDQYQSALLEKDHYSVPELAQKWGVCRATIHNKILKGEIKAFKVGRHYCVSTEVVDQLERKDVIAEQELARKDHYSIPEFAAEFGLSRFSVFKKVQDGQIKARKVGGRYVIPKDFVEAQPDVAKQLYKEKHKDYESVPNVAKHLGISRIAVFKKIRKGQLKAVKIGRSYAVPKEEISRGKRITK